MSEPHPVDEGVARLDSVLAGTRMNAERALRELHGAMQRDLRRAERRAERRLAFASQAARPSAVSSAVSGAVSGAADTARKALGGVKRKVR